MCVYRASDNNMIPTHSIHYYYYCRFLPLGLSSASLGSLLEFGAAERNQKWTQQTKSFVSNSIFESVKLATDLKFQL